MRQSSKWPERPLESSPGHSGRKQEPKATADRAALGQRSIQISPLPPNRPPAGDSGGEAG